MGGDALTTPLAKGGYVFGRVSLSVSEQHYSKSYERIAMKERSGVVQGRTDKIMIENWVFLDE